ncbi:heavy-metal-associated domain-containing protein [Rhodopila globiformis]|uniref:Copper resistance protein CopZ n=1 Tax=Rhodopila globiformis TaxID=1071 RepID=A0A2S6NMH4_RHOGL|nr:heavy-metal-associated domain-containing protein [Rhodopila globiformis]PPQ37295.1 copper resistance protein CopZ [Rhodopila globiformis]
MSVFRVPDMHCDGCVRSVTGAVRDLDEKATVQADLQTRQVRVETTASDEAVAAAIREAGFTVEG